ncbi:pyridoxamine 5'-phosphate oxidase [Rhizosphaericola mali]|uniref:Pyridoxine/pyridoxamine 5'-phosphate oxidase n=1 Tax=Rhizosphaericola mali TaxID=2545455 RepID=A0A5P2G5X8_9BACT|nr:pyridoxamine 5'-phosphate oxidase [Rhizosphaericola mali]QES89609.1 pyridoxamine 5'-phosphate oxidase [Rhizosphaericola mali]
MDIGNIRTDYQLKVLEEKDVKSNPFDMFQIWWEDAVKSQIEEVNAITLATVDANNLPDARIVLLKDYDKEGFHFFTNYESQKGKELAVNPNAALVFFWKELQRQIRIIGKVVKTTPEESDQYFHSRPLGSQIGAWCSPQSSVIASRAILEHNQEKYSLEFGKNIPRPDNWGGYKVIPFQFEFWQGRHSRLHDRFKYILKEGVWQVDRLAP